MELRFPVILDGATGTEMHKRGFDGSISPERWCLEHPEVIIGLQREYVEAGSQILYTPTFGANRVKLEHNGIFGKVEEYNMGLAAITREAAGGKAFVAGSLAPTGKFLYPLGDMRFEELVEIYTEQAAALEKAGVDLFVIETMMTLPEARAAVLAVKSVSAKPVFVSFTCDENGRSLTGTDVCAALIVMEGMGVNAFGLNCSAGPAEMLPQIKRLGEISSLPIIAKANAGMPQLVEGKTVYNCSPEEFAAHIPALVEAGARIFGGCCGTHSGHISAIAAGLEGMELDAPAPVEYDALPCATEKNAYFLDPAVEYSCCLECSEELEDELMDALEEDGEMIAIAIDSMEQLEDFADCQYMISKPLCLVCDDAEVLEQALRLYQGRALYEGSLSDEELLPLAEKYGLII